MLSLPDLQSATIPLFFLSATISLATQPGQKNTISEDIYWNIVHVSPEQIPFIVLSSFLRLASLRVLNIGKFNMCMMFMSQINRQLFSPGPSTGFSELAFRRQSNKFFALARWLFFLAVTGPLGVGIWYLPGVLWIKFWAASLAVYFVFREISSFYACASKDKSISINKNWPEGPLMVPKTPSKEDLEAMRKAYLEAKLDPTFPETLKSWKEGLRTTWSSCEAIGRVVKIVKEGDIGQEEFATKTPPAAQSLLLDHALWNNHFVWKCGHVRCLLHKVLVCSAISISSWQIFVAIALVAWIMHVDLRFLSIALVTPLFKIKVFYSLFCITWMTSLLIGTFIWANAVVNLATTRLLKVKIRGYELERLSGHFIMSILKIGSVLALFLLVLWLGVGNVIIRPLPTPTLIAWPVEAVLYGGCAASSIWLAKVLVGKKKGGDMEAGEAVPDVKDAEAGTSPTQAENKELEQASSIKAEDTEHHKTEPSNEIPQTPKTTPQTEKAEQEDTEASKKISEKAKKKAEVEENERLTELFWHLHILLLAPAAIFWYFFCIHRPEAAALR